MHKIQPIKRERELHHGRLFLDRLGIVTDQPVQRGESPDLRMTIEGRNIGVEVTEFFFPSADPDTPNYLPFLQNRAVYEAWQKFRGNGGPPLYVSFFFSEESTRCGPQTAKERDALANRLCEVVTANGAPTYGAWTFDISSEVPEVDWYVIEPSLRGTDEQWSISRATMGANVPPAFVQERLNSKADKHPRYVQICPEVWLLIVNDWPMQAPACRIGEAARSARYSFPFDRAFWMDLDGDLVELRKLE